MNAVANLQDLPIEIYLQELPIEIWGEIKSHAGWEAMRHVGMTCKEAQQHWKGWIVTPAQAKDYFRFDLARLVQDHRYEWSKESALDPETHSVRELKKQLPKAELRSNQVYISLPTDIIEVLFKHFRTGHSLYFRSVKDKKENKIYSWADTTYITPFLLCNDTPDIRPRKWKIVNLGKMIKGLDSFGDRLLVAITRQSLIFLDRKTLEFVAEYPHFTDITEIETDFEKGTITVADSVDPLNHTKLKFSNTAPTQKSKIPLYDILKPRVKKIYLFAKIFFTSLFSRQELSRLGKEIYSDLKITTLSVGLLGAVVGGTISIALLSEFLQSGQRPMSDISIFELGYAIVQISIIVTLVAFPIITTAVFMVDIGVYMLKHFTKAAGDVYYV